MTISLRTTLLTGLAMALALPAAAQDLPAQPVLEEDAVPVLAPPSSLLTLPPAPQYPAVMQWPAAHARKLLAGIESTGAEGLDPADYRPGALRGACETGACTQPDSLAGPLGTLLGEDLRGGRTPREA